MNLFEIKKENNMPDDNKSEKILDAFNDKYVEHKREGSEKLSIGQYLD